MNKANLQPLSTTNQVLADFLLISTVFTIHQQNWHDSVDVSGFAQTGLSLSCCKLQSQHKVSKTFSFTDCTPKERTSGIIH